jgi:hypothetical protein
MGQIRGEHHAPNHAGHAQATARCRTTTSAATSVTMTMRKLVDQLSEYVTVTWTFVFCVPGRIGTPAVVFA